MKKGNCTTAKVMPDHYMIPLCCQSLHEHLEAASSCFANTENLNEQVLIQKILLAMAIKSMQTQFKFTLRLICTPEYKYTSEYIYTRVFFAHANWTLFLIRNIFLEHSFFRT